ncbi:MAG: 30S ribosomal protein S16 [Candidatus Eremiobacterota bacterium]
MVRLRLTRCGKKKQPTYRLVAADGRSPRDGRFIEILGHYNPRTEPPTVNFKRERILDWLKKGAQPSESVKLLLVQGGIWKEFTGADHVWPAPKPKAKPEAEPAAV